VFSPRLVASFSHFWSAPRPTDLVVRCARRAYRVRLARGRFWADDVWIEVRSRFGPNLGSGHAPLLADLRLR